MKVHHERDPGWEVWPLVLAAIALTATAVIAGVLFSVAEMYVSPAVETDHTRLACKHLEDRIVNTFNPLRVCEAQQPRR